MALVYVVHERFPATLCNLQRLAASLPRPRPSLRTAFGLAPLSSKASATAWWPPCTARWSAVTPRHPSQRKDGQQGYSDPLVHSKTPNTTIEKLRGKTSGPVVGKSTYPGSTATCLCPWAHEQTRGYRRAIPNSTLPL